MNHAKSDFYIIFIVSLCLVVVIIGTYMQVRNFDFIGYDDNLYVTENPYVQKGVSLEGIKWAFTTFHSANWHPMTWLSHMLDFELYGLNPAGHHWANVEFHIANTLLLFIILFKMTGALWQSAFVAALFALHPLHVESVAWVSERKDVLSTFFGLLSIAAYCCYVKKSSAKYYILVIAFLCIGLMAKPILVTIPFVLLLLDFWPLRRFQYTNDFLLKSETAKDVIRKNYRIILEKIPLFAPIVISCVLTFLAQRSDGAVKPLEALPLKYRVANALVSYVTYVLKAVWPHKLAIFYPHPGNTLPLWQIMGATLLIAAACVLAIRAAKKYPYIAVGLFWYLGTLVPVIGLVQVGDQAMADRYTYIPLIGFFIMIVWSVNDLFKKWRFHKLFFGILSIILLVALSWKTFFQLTYWKNGITLFEHAISVTDNNYLAQNNLGTAYAPVDLNKAIFHYRSALKLKPRLAVAFYNLGNVYIRKGQIDEAIHHYLKALQIKPDYLDALNNLGMAYLNRDDYDKAALYFETALKINPQKANVRNNLANIYVLEGKIEKAIFHYKKLIGSNHENADFHYNLALALETQRKIDEAILNYKESLRIDPKHSKAHYGLGNLLLSQGKVKEAVHHFAEAIKFEPNYVQVYDKLGMILFRQGKFNKAKVLFSKAIEIDPKYLEARNHLDTLNKILLTRNR